MIKLKYNSAIGIGFEFLIDREKKTLYVRSETTNHLWQRMNYIKALYDKDDNVEEIEKLCDEDFVNRITDVMTTKAGYILVESDLNVSNPFPS